MKLSIQLLSSVLLAAAVAAWWGVGYMSLHVFDLASESAATMISDAQRADAAAYQKRLKALSADTESDRAKLEQFMHQDVVTIATMIESAGQSLGVSAKVHDASVLGSAIALSDDQSLRTISFVVQADGSFSSLMRLVHAYENLPLPSSVGDIELDHAPATATSGGPWHLTVRVRVLTTAPVSL